MRNGFLWLVLCAFIMTASGQKLDIKPIDVGNNDDYSGFEVLDSLLVGKRFIVSGEDFSYSRFNAKLELKLLKYLHDHAEVYNYILPGGPSKAYLVNRYLEKGDSASEYILQAVSSMKTMREYRNLKRWNDKQQVEKKIRIYGVDVERNSALPLIRIADILPKDSIPDNVRIAVESLNGVVNYIVHKGMREYEREKEGKADDSYFYNPSVFTTSETINEFLKFYDSSKKNFQIWLGDRFYDLDESVGWLKEFKEYQSYKYDAYQYNWREEVIRKRVLRLLQSSPDEKYFGQFELMQVSTKRIAKANGLYDFNSFVQMVTDNSAELEKATLNIALFYSAEENVRSSSIQMDNFNLESHYLSRNALSKSAFFVSTEVLRDSLPELSQNFKAILVNNYYPSSEYEESDDSTSRKKTGRKIEWNSAYKDQGYFGFHYMQHAVKLSDVNEVLSSNGFNKIKEVNSYGALINFASWNQQNFRMFVGSSFSPKSYYKNWRAEVGYGYNFIFTDYIKSGISLNYGYVKHTLSLRDTLGVTRFFSDVKPLKEFVNPAFYIGASLSFSIDLEPVYLYFEGGYNRDLGSARWKLNNKFTGDAGGLSNSSFFGAAGIGLSFPLD